MSYNPTENYNTELRNPSGIVFFGKNPSSVMLDSSSSFTIDENNSRLIVPNITLANNGQIGNSTHSDILTFNTDGTTEFVSGVRILGDLIVEGNQVIVNTETVTIDDNIIVLNDNNTSGLDQDAGIEIERGAAGNNVQLLWNEGDDLWTFTNNGSNYYRISSNDAVAAGSGLVPGGIVNETRVLHIGGGVGINVLDNWINVTGVPNTSLQNSSITISAGSGLAHGGSINLGGTGILDIGQGNGITVSANAIAVNPGSGISVDSNGVHVDSTIITDQILMPSGDVVGNEDQILIYDSGVGLKRITGNDFIAGLDILTSFNVTDGTNNSSLDRDESLKFTGGTGIQATVSTVNNAPVVTLDVDSTVVQTTGALQTISKSLIFNCGTGGSANDFFVSGTVPTFSLIPNSTFGSFIDFASNGPGPSSFSNSVYMSYDPSENNQLRILNEEGNIVLQPAQNGYVVLGENDSSNGSGIKLLADPTSSSATYFPVFTSGPSTPQVVYSRTASQVKSDIGLGSVENVSVSSLGGSGLQYNASQLHVVVDNSTLEISSDTVRVKDGGISTIKLADDSVTESKLSRAIQTTSSSVSASGDIILCTGGSGGITITLPAIASNEGRMLFIKKVDSGAGPIIIDGNASETIDGALTKRLYYQYESMSLVCDASAGWYIV